MIGRSIWVSMNGVNCQGEGEDPHVCETLLVDTIDTIYCARGIYIFAYTHKRTVRLLYELHCITVGVATHTWLLEINPSHLVKIIFIIFLFLPRTRDAIYQLEYKLCIAERINSFFTLVKINQVVVYTVKIVIDPIYTSVFKTHTPH